MKKIFIITGEHSGDKHASNVARKILEKNPNVSIEAVGGKNLEAAGVKLFCNHEKMSAMGLSFQILINHIMLGKKIAKYLIEEYKPDLVLLVDYGGFNLRIANILKKAGLKIFYYIPPQIWASRKWRINSVKKYIDKVITIFPFEIDMYKKAGINAVFAGHPLVNQLPTPPLKEKFFEENNLDLSKKLISIFPGSRVFEINNLLDIFIEAAKIIEKKVPNVQFVICQAPTIKDELLKNKIPQNIKILKNKNYELLGLSDALILASGTVALEAALYNTPMIISYRGPELFYYIYLLVRCIKRVSLPNIILDKDVVPELIQHLAKPQIIAKEIIKLMENESEYKKMKEELENVKNFLTNKNSAEEAAQIILEDLQ
jgi:lipid-A-disaccharide synthase